MEIKVNGRLRTKDELREEAVDMLVSALEDLDSDDALELGNAYRVANHDNELYTNDEDNINSELEGKDPYEILQMASSWSDCDDYFSRDSYDELGTTNDVWEGIDMNDLADDLINGCYGSKITEDITDILDEYEEALEALDNYNEGRLMAEEVIKKYVNCEATVTDLLQCLDKLVRNDDYWAEE